MAVYSDTFKYKLYSFICERKTPLKRFYGILDDFKSLHFKSSLKSICIYCLYVNIVCI